MFLFLIGIIILVFGYIVYGSFIESVFEPDERYTPAHEMKDGMDYIPLDISKNSLVQLLNIAGTGAIFGPIAGILWGPIVFLIIPLGNVFAGAMLDYLSSMISLRENASISSLIEKYLGRTSYKIFSIIGIVLLLLVGAVYATIPVDIIMYEFFGVDSIEPSTKKPYISMFIFFCIFVYYIFTTIMPINKIVNKIYPFFAIIMLISTVSVVVSLFIEPGWLDAINEFATFDKISLNAHPENLPIFPLFFVTVTCGLLSGFHSIQSSVVVKTVNEEKDGKKIFYGMMILEGAIAMVWAAAGIVAINVLQSQGSSVEMVVDILHNALPGILGYLAIIGVVIIPLTTGDTAFRIARVSIAEQLKIEQKNKVDAVFVAIPIFIIIVFIIVWGKIDADGFDRLWRYFAWANQTISVFLLYMISVYIYLRFKGSKKYMISFIPAVFYTMVVTSYFIGGNGISNINNYEGFSDIVRKNGEIGIGIGYDINAFITYGLTAIITTIIVFMFFSRIKKLQKLDDVENNK